MNGICVNKKIKRKYAHIFDHFQKIFIINLFYFIYLNSKHNWHLKFLIALVGKVSDVSKVFNKDPIKAVLF